MADVDLDIREIENGVEVTFELENGMTAIGEVTAYLGEGLYEIRNQDDDELHEIMFSDITRADED